MVDTCRWFVYHLSVHRATKITRIDRFAVGLCTIWATSWQNQQNKPRHPPSLIRVFAVRMKTAWVLSYQLSTQRRLWSDWADAQADLSLRWVQSHFVDFVTRRLIYLNTNLRTLREQTVTYTLKLNIVSGLSINKGNFIDKTLMSSKLKLAKRHVRLAKILVWYWEGMQISLGWRFIYNSCRWAVWRP